MAAPGGALLIWICVGLIPGLVRYGIFMAVGSWAPGHSASVVLKVRSGEPA